MLVVTSNNLDMIHEAMKRPGRFDAIIHVPAPDANAALQLVKMYGRGRVDETDPRLPEVGVAMAGKIPAMIREAVEGSKLSAINRSGGNPNEKLSAADLLLGAARMDDHLTAMATKRDERLVPISVRIGGKKSSGALALAATNGHADGDTGDDYDDD